jgi:hypothetical protein
VVADTFAGPIHVEWDNSAPLTPLGQLPFSTMTCRRVALRRADDSWRGGWPSNAMQANNIFRRPENAVLHAYNNCKLSHPALAVLNFCTGK